MINQVSILDKLKLILLDIEFIFTSVKPMNEYNICNNKIIHLHSLKKYIR